MWHENIVKNFLGGYLFVISFTHAAFSQRNMSAHPAFTPIVIHNLKVYKKSIKANSNNTVVALKQYITPLFSDFKYATINNFTHHILYVNPDVYVRLPTAIALKKIQEELALKGVGLKFFDAYRPYSITKKMWKIVPDERYAANPAKGSDHNRGAAVDVTLINITTGEELAMPTYFDEFSEKAHHNYKDLPAEVLQNRELLKTTMEKYGFEALSTEWWHYSLLHAARFPLLNLSFKQLKHLED